MRMPSASAVSTSSRTPYAGSTASASPVSRSPMRYTKLTICCATRSSRAKSRPASSWRKYRRSPTVRTLSGVANLGRGAGGFADRRRRSRSLRRRPGGAVAATNGETRTVYRTCPLCEATCGLELRLEGKDITLVRGDRDDVFSHGFLCPKGTALKQLESDPDRLRRPQVRRGDSWHEVSWADAFAEVERGLTPIFEQYGRDAVAMYMGNPNVHNLARPLYSRVLIQAVGSKNLYSAGTVDQMPKQVSAGLMFGMALSMPIPDIDRTDYLLILGANPFASNGSLMTAPDYPGRLRALRARGGKFVVVDPRRSKTAEEADEHLFIRPGTDAPFLFGVVHTLFDDGLASLGTVADHVVGVEEVERLARDFAPDAVAPVCGIDSQTIRRTARELSTASRAAVYGRIGTCTQEFGTLASWLVDVVNALTGNLDRPGGAMFTKPAAGSANTGGKPGIGRGVRFGRRRSPVR